MIVTDLKKETSDIINNALGIETQEVETEESTDLVPVEDSIIAKAEEVHDELNDIHKQYKNVDFVTARNTINHILEKGQEALLELMQIGKLNNHPRSFEIAAGVMKGMSDAAKDLLDIQEKMNKLEETKPTGDNPVGGQQAGTINNIFTTASLNNILTKKIEDGVEINGDIDEEIQISEQPEAEES